MLKRISAFAGSFVLSIASLFVLTPAIVHATADTCAWVGGTDLNFNTAANWNCSVDGAAIPEDGDALTFDSTTFTNGLTLANDIPGGLSVTGITVTGNGSNSLTIGGTETLTVTGDIANASSNFLYFTNPLVFGANASITGNNGINASNVAIGSFNLNISAGSSFSGQLSGSGTITVAASKYFSLTGGTNSFTGALQVNGAMNISSPAPIATVSGITVADGAYLNLSLGNSTGAVDIDTPITLLGDGITGQIPVAALNVYYGVNTGLVSLTDVTLSADSTFNSSGSVDNATAITATLNGHKITRLDGSQGQLTVNDEAVDSNPVTYTYESPADDYTGAAFDGIVGDKNIHIFNNQTTGNFIVEKGGVIKGKGKIGNLTVEDGGIVAPGESPGCLSMGNLVLNAGATYEFEVGGAKECDEYDRMKVTGTVDVTDAILSINLYNGFKPAAGQSYMIIENDSNDAVVGAFTNLAEGAEVSVGGYVMNITYKGGDGNDVVLTVKNIPTTPNTGFSLLTSHPLITMITTTLLAAAIALIARRYNKLLAK